MEKPACVKTHMRNMLILPEMIGSVVGIHTGKVFNQVEIKVRDEALCTAIYCHLGVIFLLPLGRDGWALFRRVCYDLQTSQTW